MADDGSVPARVIIADDHPLFRSALTRILEEHSEFKVVSQAADGIDGVRARIWVTRGV